MTIFYQYIKDGERKGEVRQAIDGYEPCRRDDMTLAFIKDIPVGECVRFGPHQIVICRMKKWVVKRFIDAVDANSAIIQVAYGPYGEVDKWFADEE